ncbi:MAG: hypothetical protein JF592_02145 [Microbacterium sp.]|uniref:hypothetical protein n=1 Tax=Microbacterium sp. TaxID=51671 RepID=UPI001D339742|nr:hypothetical protein [Microbacterium sp.]MBW8761368.1 hypothetical protein [Microbacterium sp.]
MTRTSGGRLAAAIVVGLAVLPLSGCLYAQIPEHPTVVDDDPVPTDDPVDEPTEEPVAGMSFADGATLSPSSYVEWGDGFFADDSWKIVKPDDGNGGWTYGTVDGTCTAQFWQGHIDNIMTAGDDSVSSDAMMATFLEGGATTADITPLASTSGFSYQTAGNTAVENRMVSGSGDGVEWTLAARAFTAVGVGLYVVVDCTGGDVDAVWDEVVSKNAIVITG